MKAALLFLFAGFAMVFYFREERARLERQKIAEQTKGMGRPKVGGPFKLLDHNGHTYTSEDLKGKYALVGHDGMVDLRAFIDQHNRSISASHIARISALTSSTRWQR